MGARQTIVKESKNLKNADKILIGH